MFNAATIVGFLVEDPTLKETRAGSVCSMRIGFDGRAKDNKAYINVEVWGKVGEACAQYLTKGRNVVVSGGLKMDTWEDKTSGAKKSALILVADAAKFLPSPAPKDGDKPQAKTDKPSSKSSPKPSSEPQDGGGDDYDDIPF